MLSTIITTVGDPDANSYISLEEATAYFAGRFTIGDGWNAYTNDQKTSRLLQAALVLDRLQYLGEPATDTQAMQWPRRSTYELGHYSTLRDALGHPIRVDEIPQSIKYAQAELALVIFDEDGQVFGDFQEMVKSETLGKWSISYVPNRPLLPSEVVLNLLMPFLVESTRCERA